MKFFKIIMAIFVLFILKDSFLFGLETPELEQTSEIEQIEKMGAAKDKAIKVLNAYINIPSRDRVQRNIELAERALKIINLYNEMVAGPLTQAEQQIIARAEGALPIDKMRLTGGARTKAMPTRGAMPTRTAQRAITVKRPAVGATRTRVVSRRQTNVRPRRQIVTRYGVQIPRYGSRIPTKREVKILKRTGRTRGITPAPMVVPTSESTKEFKDRIAYFFGGSLKNFFVGFNLNRAEFNIVLQVLEFDRQIANISRDDAYKFIIETINNNKNSEITSEQEQLLKNYLSVAPVLHEIPLP